MERTVARWLAVEVSEIFSCLIKLAIFLSVCGATLFIAWASSYPAVHDTLPNARHALAVFMALIALGLGVGRWSKRRSSMKAAARVIISYRA